MSPRKRSSPPGPWAKKLIELREKWGKNGKPLTQAEAAKKLGVSLRTWANWELNQSPIPKPIQTLIVLLLKQK